jgi:hypothetical protein
MILTKSDLPSQGFFSVAEDNTIEIKPLTFGELIRYLGDPQLDKIREYIRALNFLINKDPRIGQVNILDADYLIYLFKAVSSSKGASFSVSAVCTKCKSNLSTQVKAKNLFVNKITNEGLTIDSINLANQDIKIRYITINEFINFISRLDLLGNNDLPIDVIKLASMLEVDSPNKALSYITEASLDDISLISYLDSLWFHTVQPIKLNCHNCKDEGGATVGFAVRSGLFSRHH